MTRIFMGCLAMAVAGAVIYAAAFWFYPQEGGDPSVLNDAAVYLGAGLFVGAVLVFFVAGTVYLVRGGGA